VRETERGNRVAVLSRDKTDVSRGGGNKWCREEDGWVISNSITIRLPDVSYPNLFVTERLVPWRWWLQTAPLMVCCLWLQGCGLLLLLQLDPRTPYVFLEIYALSLDTFIWNNFKATFITSQFHIVLLQIIIKSLIHVPWLPHHKCLWYLTHDQKKKMPKFDVAHNMFIKEYLNWLVDSDLFWAFWWKPRDSNKNGRKMAVH